MEIQLSCYAKNGIARPENDSYAERSEQRRILYIKIDSRLRAKQTSWEVRALSTFRVGSELAGNQTV